MDLPFDAAKLDSLMDEAGIELLLATDKDTIQYLTGYRFFFLSHKDAIGISRYLPVLGLPKAAPENAFYIGCSLEPPAQEVNPLWVPNIANNQWISANAGRDAGRNIKQLGLENATIAVEKCFIPADAYEALQGELPGATFVDALPMLQRLRAIKSQHELEYLRQASEMIVDCMTTVMTSTKAGTTTAQIARDVHTEEVKRGMHFEYCLTAAGTNLNRTPCDKFTWDKGEVLSLDSGANWHGYLGDLCRMAVMGEPTPLMVDLLDEVRAIQDAPRKVIRPGVTGAELYEAALAEKEKCDHRDQIHFFAHGMGMIQHEAPHLEPKGVVPYDAPYQDLPLEAGMVLSIETALKNPEVGLVKLEDTVAVTGNGHEGFGDGARDWVINAG
ncbi:MAG: aminopeptidase P family protein [Rhizobiales bacterium]|nr:aminopeptidase P family protein [Hyphomicrobiales bacterium]